MAQENYPRDMTYSHLFHHGIAVIGCASRPQSFGDPCSIRCAVVDSWPRALSCGDVWWTVMSAGPLVACRACVWRNAGGALVEPCSEE